MPMPSLDLLRSVTDEHVLRTVMERGRATRAELSGVTGISKPTISESVRRLAEAGLLVDTGERTSGRGRSGSYFALSPRSGNALAVSIAPDGVIAEVIDVLGGVAARSEQEVSRAADPGEAAGALTRAVDDVRRQHHRPSEKAHLRVAVVGAADPVDRATGRLIHLPDSPFLVGELSPAEVLGGSVDGKVLVDNDVNWAAQAERDGGGARDAADFVYLYLGEGLGAAIVSDGEVRRGAGGLAGEIAHLMTSGPQSKAMPFTDVFAELGLRQAGSTAIDVERLAAAVRESPGPKGAAETLARAVCGVLAACVALADPELIIVGGPWGAAPAFLDRIRDAFAAHPRRVPVHAAELTEEPVLAGVRHQALVELRTLIVASAAR